MNRIRTLLALLLVATYGSGCTLLRAVWHNEPTLNDQYVFASRVVPRGEEVAMLPAANLPDTTLARFVLPWGPHAGQSLEGYLADTATAAFVVVSDGRIVYERYARGYSETTLFNAFSVAKSVVSTLVGIAVAEGHIRSLQQTVAEYCPELAGTTYGAVTLRNLLAMRSGAGEPDSLLGAQAEQYYGEDLRRLVADVPRQAPQGAQYRYRESDVQALAFVLEAATGRKLADYLSEKLWRPLGMEADGQWSLDHPDGSEKAFCCLSARARDFARFGMLYANGGVVSGRQVLPIGWIELAAAGGSRAYKNWDHGRLWWHPADEAGDFVAYGYKGQNVYVSPETRVVIVKFSEEHQPDPLPLFRGIARALNAQSQAAAAPSDARVHFLTRAAALR